MTNPINSDQSYSGVAQTASLGTSTSVGSGAAKIFREFKWGLLTLVLLMAVVIFLIPPKKGKTETAQNKANSTELEKDLLSPGLETGLVNGIGNIPEPANGPAGTDGIGRTNRNSDEMRPDPFTPTPDSNSQPGRVANGGNNINPGPIQNTLQPGPNRNGMTNRQPAEQPNAEDHTRSRTNARQPEPRAPMADSGLKTYTVKPGDNLTKIASANLPGKGGMKAILDANKDVLPDANRLREGMKLKIPGSVGSGAETARGNHDNAQVLADGERRRPTGAHDEYVVQSGDTLERIARRVLNDPNKWKDLMEWNKDRISDASKLKVGMVLRIHPGSQTSPAFHPTDTWRRNPSGTIRAGLEPEMVHEREESVGEEAPIPVHPISKNNPVSANSKVENPKSETPIP